MARALSGDLRRRLVDAVKDGMSRRGAAARFGVSVSSAIRWVAQAGACGDVSPRKQGGDRRSGRIEACKDLILALREETPDITLEEMRQGLAERGHAFGYGTIQRFFKRHRITRKKRPLTRPSRHAPTF